MTKPNGMPLLSICIPTYNRADLLKYCLDNLRALDSTGIDYEVVVVNHASTDNTAEMLNNLIKEWPRLRFFSQAHQVSMIGQHISVLRMAKGEFLLTMADDDKLIAEKVAEYVRYMEAHPEVVVTYAPWLAYDDAVGKVLHGYFEVPQRITFKPGQGADLFHFITERGIYPEICMYRATIFRHMFSIPGGPLHNFMWLIEFLRHGDVVFQPDVFYLEVAVIKPEFPPITRVNVELATAYLDQARAGLEVMVMRIIQAAGGDIIAPEARQKVHEVLLNYLVTRLEVMFNRAYSLGDYLAASGLAQRIMLWRGPFRQDFAQVANTLLFGAGVQQIGWMLQSMSWKSELIIYDFTAEEPIETILRLKFKDIKIRYMDAAGIRALEDRQPYLLMVRNEKQKGLFTDCFLPGEIISLEEAIEFNKICPLTYSLEKQPAAA